jgi:hypothetical protein
MFHRDASVGLLDFGLVGTAIDAQHLVVVSFRHRRVPEENVGMNADLHCTIGRHRLSA